MPPLQFVERIKEATRVYLRYAETERLRDSMSLRRVVAVIVVVGLSSLILHYAGGIYYKLLL